MPPLGRNKRKLATPKKILKKNSSSSLSRDLETPSLSLK